MTGGPRERTHPPPHTAPRPRWATLLTEGAVGEGGGARARRQRVAHSCLHSSGGWAHHPHSGGGERCAGGVGTPRGRPPRPRQRWARRGATAGATVATHPTKRPVERVGARAPAGPWAVTPRLAWGRVASQLFPFPPREELLGFFLRGPPTYLSRRPHPRVWPPATVAARQMAKISTTPPRPGRPPRAPTRGVMVIPAAPRLGPLARAARGSLSAALWSATPVTHAGTTRAGRAETHTRPRRDGCGRAGLGAPMPASATAGAVPRTSWGWARVARVTRHALPPPPPPAHPVRGHTPAAAHTHATRRAERRGGASLVAVPARAAAHTRPLPPAGPKRAPDRSVTPSPPPPP